MTLSKIPTLAARYDYLETMLSGYDDEITKSNDDVLKLWAREHIVSALSTLSHAEEEEGRILALIRQRFGEDFLMEK